MCLVCAHTIIFLENVAEGPRSLCFKSFVNTTPTRGEKLISSREVQSSIGEVCSGANGKVQIFFSKLHRATMILEIFFQLENTRECRRNVLRCV